MIPDLNWFLLMVGIDVILERLEIVSPTRLYWVYAGRFSMSYSRRKPHNDVFRGHTTIFMMNKLVLTLLTIWL